MFTLLTVYVTNMLTLWGKGLKALIDRSGTHNAQLWLQMIGIAQVNIQCVFGHEQLQQCDRCQPVFQVTRPPLYSTRPNCLLCSSCWLSSSLFDISKMQVVSVTWIVVCLILVLNLSTYCQICVRSQQCHFKMLFYVYFYGDLIDWLNAAIDPIILSW